MHLIANSLLDRDVFRRKLNVRQINDSQMREPFTIDLSRLLTCVLKKLIHLTDFSYLFTRLILVYYAYNCCLFTIFNMDSR